MQRKPFSLTVVSMTVTNRRSVISQLFFETEGEALAKAKQAARELFREYSHIQAVDCTIRNQDIGANVYHHIFEDTEL